MFNTKKLYKYTEDIKICMPKFTVTPTFTYTIFFPSRNEILFNTLVDNSQTKLIRGDDRVVSRYLSYTYIVYWKKTSLIDSNYTNIRLKTRYRNLCS